MKALLIANWKMNVQTPDEARDLLAVTKRSLLKMRRVSVVLAPPALFVSDLARRTRGSTLAFAVQNIHFERTGAFTGETSAQQARSVGAQYALIGHSERRKMGEKNDEVGKKAAIAIATGLKAIVCVGEEERRDDGVYLADVAAQLKAAIAPIAPEYLSRLIIAYEPVWNIGGSNAMDPRDMHEMAIYIRKLLSERFGEAGMRVPILYGGSITSQSAAHMIKEGDVQGLLVGHMSVEKESWARIISSVSDA